MPNFPVRHHILAPDTPRANHAEWCAPEAAITRFLSKGLHIYTQDSPQHLTQLHRVGLESRQTLDTGQIAGRFCFGSEGIRMLTLCEYGGLRNGCSEMPFVKREAFSWGKREKIKRGRERQRDGDRQTETDRRPSCQRAAFSHACTATCFSTPTLFRVVSSVTLLVGLSTNLCRQRRNGRGPFLGYSETLRFTEDRARRFLNVNLLRFLMVSRTDLN